MASLEQITEEQLALSDAITTVRAQIINAYEVGDERAADLLDWYKPGEFPLSDGRKGKIAIDGMLYTQGYGEPHATATVTVKGEKPVHIEFDQNPVRGEKLVFWKGKKAQKTWIYGEGQPAPKFVTRTLGRLGLNGLED